MGDAPVRGPLPHEIAFVFQENALFPWSTVIDNVKLGMLFQGVRKSSAKSGRKSLLKPSAWRTSPTTIRANCPAA